MTDSFTPTSEVDGKAFQRDFSSLMQTREPTEIAVLYDAILARLEKLLVPRKQKQLEYFDDQKFLYYTVVRMVVGNPEVHAAMQRFQQDLEDFFRKKPAFQWKGLDMKDIIDLAINVPLSLSEILKLVVTKTGQFMVQRIAESKHRNIAEGHAKKETKTITDGHLLSSCREVLLPFLRSVKEGPDYDHPVVISLYAYLMPIFDKLVSIFIHSSHPRARNIFDKIIVLRTELEGIMHLHRPRQRFTFRFRK